jgi:O-antigen/teichoic acid export membrane protein
MIRSSVIYLLGGLLTKAIPFILLPILTRYLTPEEYGTVALFQVLLLLTIPFVGMNLQTNISRNFTKLNRAEMAQLIGTLAALLCCSMTIVIFLISLWILFVGQLFDISSGWLFVLPLVAAFHTANQFNMTVLRNQEQPITFAALEVTNSLINIGISIILVVMLQYGWQGRVLAIVFSTCCLGLFGILLLYKQKLIIFGFNKNVVKNVLSISLPLIPHALGGVIVTMSDRIFIEKLISKEAVGVYVVGYTFGMLVNLFVESFSRAWSPWYYKQMSKNNSKENRQQIVQYTYIYFIIILLLALAVSSCSKWLLPFLVTPEYQGASKYILWISFGYAFRGVYTVIFPCLVFAGKTSFLAIGTTGIALINLLLNYCLIHLNGPVGAAQATLISWFLLLLCTWLYSTRICPMPWLYFMRIEE